MKDADWGKTFGWRLWQIRTAYGITESEFAWLLGFPNVSSYLKVESGDAGIGMGKFRLLANYINIDLNCLIRGKAFDPSEVLAYKPPEGEWRNYKPFWPKDRAETDFDF